MNDSLPLFESPPHQHLSRLLLPELELLCKDPSVDEPVDAAAGAVPPDKTGGGYSNTAFTLPAEHPDANEHPGPEEPISVV